MSGASTPCFNEAAGFTRRKPRPPGPGQHARACFNEAAGFTRRKLELEQVDARRGNRASMRPPDLPGGNGVAGQRRCAPTTGFNEAAGFTRRKPKWALDARQRYRCSFNEAAGFTRRKQRGLGHCQCRGEGEVASMRPPDLPGGNTELSGHGYARKAMLQ